MEHIFAKLLQDFEQGKMTRRQLIQSLAATAAAVSVAGAEPPAQVAGAPFAAINVNHISFDVADYAKTRDFYAGLFGMRVWNDNNGVQCRLQCGPTHLTVRSRDANTPRVEHIAIEIENYDVNVVAAELKRRNIPVEFDAGGDPKIKDPGGFIVQISPKAYVPGDYRERQERQSSGSPR